jgi:hypothetical protein
MGKFKEHGVMMYLDTELYVPFVKLQADKGLGRSFAALLSFVEGLYSLGFISKEVYESHKRKYSLPLLAQKTLAEVVDKEPDQLNKTLGMVLDQWEDHPKREWRRKWMDTARLHPDLPNAKRVLQLEQEVTV